MQLDYVIGWDIGGAHIKGAVASTPETIYKITQSSCQLWLGIQPLQSAMRTILEKFEISQSMHAVTMTGELVDHFANRKDGVIQLVNEITNTLQNNEVMFFAGNNGFVNSQQTTSEYNNIASANWLASANYVAGKISEALFIDIGSTTSDIIRISKYSVINEGYADADRLYAQELVYCGVVRTPVFALCKAAPIGDKFIPVINEYFSNAADVYRLTNELPVYADLSDTSDGRGKDEASSAARLARMFGHDAKLEEASLWRQVAQYVREQQLQMIINACRKQLTKFAEPQNVPIVGAGVGRFLIQEIAQRFNRRYIDFESLCKCESTDNEFNAGDCAPAASVACLAYQRFLHD